MARAAQLLGAASVLLESCETPLKVEEQAQYEASAHAARNALETASWQIAWTAGRTLSLEQALALAC